MSYLLSVFSEMTYYHHMETMARSKRQFQSLSFYLDIITEKQLSVSIVALKWKHWII